MDNGTNTEVISNLSEPNKYIKQFYHIWMTELLSEELACCHLNTLPAYLLAAGPWDGMENCFKISL